MTFYMWDTKKCPPQIQTAECESPEHEPFGFYRAVLHTLYIFFPPNTPSGRSHSFSIISYFVPAKHGLLLCSPTPFTQPCFQHLPQRLSLPQPALSSLLPSALPFLPPAPQCQANTHMSLKVPDSSHTGGFVLPDVNK